jgi:hypothetical protein
MLKLIPELEGKVSSPSVSVGSQTLFMHGPLEAIYRVNLDKSLQELLPQPVVPGHVILLHMTDPKMQNPVRVRLLGKEESMNMDAE